MAKQGQTIAQANKAIRQGELRAKLAAGGHLQHVIENIKKIECLDDEMPHFSNSLNKLKIANEQRLKLINKYLPELKATELTGADGKAIEVDHYLEVAIVDAN